MSSRGWSLLSEESLTSVTGSVGGLVRLVVAAWHLKLFTQKFATHHMIL